MTKVLGRTRTTPDLLAVERLQVLKITQKTLEKYALRRPKRIEPVVERLDACDHCPELLTKSGQLNLVSRSDQAPAARITEVGDSIELRQDPCSSRHHAGAIDEQRL